MTPREAQDGAGGAEGGSAVRGNPEADLRAQTVTTATNCWEWQGRRTPTGYGRTGAGEGAHRAMYRLLRGEIPPGLELDHTCENPPCINPDHLDALTRLEHARRTRDRQGKNRLHLAAVEMRLQGDSLQEIADALGWVHDKSAWSALKAAARKGLVSEDELPKQRQLTDEQREGIVAMRLAGATFREIGEAYGIHLSHAARISKGRRNGRIVA